MKREIELSIVISVYNSENILDELINQIGMHTGFVRSFEVVLVNDCSKDGSWNKILELSRKIPCIKGVNLRKNAGQHNAIMAGLHHACGDVIITMDDDLQHSPAYLKDLYEKIAEGYDVCYAKFGRVLHPGWKIWGSRFNDMVATVLLKKPKDLYLSSFKALSGQIRDEIIKYDGPYPYIDGLILTVTENITTLNMEHFERYRGEGNYDLRKSILLWLKMSTGFSALPLRIAAILGLFFSTLSFFLMLLYFALKFIAKDSPQGWTTLIMVMLFLGGIQLFSIGIIGEYIGRIYLNINKKPQFVIKEITF